MFLLTLKSTKHDKETILIETVMVFNASFNNISVISWHLFLMDCGQWPYNKYTHLKPFTSQIHVHVYVHGKQILNNPNCECEKNKVTYYRLLLNRGGH
jgi:hypothetical protein